MNEQAAVEARKHLQALTDLFDDASLEAGMRQITDGERKRLAKLLERAGR
jgi:hypothetical protein